MSSGTAHLHPFPWKATAPSLALSAVLLAVTACAISVLLVSYRAADQAIRRAAVGLDVAVELETNVAGMQRQLFDYFTTGDPSKLDEAHELRKAMEITLLRAERTVIAEDGSEIVSEVWGVLGDFDDMIEQSLIDRQEKHAAHAMQVINGVVDPITLEHLRQERIAAQTALDNARSDSREMTTIACGMLLLLGLSGAGVGVYSGYARARAMQQQMVELTVSVHSATGSLDGVDREIEPVAIDSSGDLSQVQSMVDLLVDRVAGVVGRLQQAERESIRSDQLASLGQLAAGLAHELRNPLTAIKTLVEAARASGPKSTLEDRDLQVIEEELARLDKTLQSFLDYARPPRASRRPIDPQRLIDDTLHLLSSQLERLGIRVETSYPVAATSVTADPEQLKQVLLNLCLNAIDATGQGGTLGVTLRATRTGDAVEIIVDDTGPGIAQNLQNRLFEPFVSSKPSGTGLGLTISRRIVEAHGGTIKAENRASGGARFTITLPTERALVTDNGHDRAGVAAAAPRITAAAVSASRPSNAVRT